MTKTNIAWCRVAGAEQKNRQKVDFDDFNYKADMQSWGTSTINKPAFSPIQFLSPV